VLVVIILLREIQCSYTQQSFSIAAWPSGVSSPPINTLSAFRRSSIAVPSARNSGFDRIYIETTQCKYKDLILSHITLFLLLYYFVATCFDPSESSSGHTGTVSEAKLHVKLYKKLQLKIYEIALHKTL
jgi:hypothetical protein